MLEWVYLLFSTAQIHPFFIGGDFNLRHPLWDSSVSHRQRSCSNFIDWYDSKGLKLLNPTDTSTHVCDGTLDLALCLDNCVKCEIRSDLHTTSDHETLITNIRRARNTQGLAKLHYKALDKDIFLRLLGNSTHVPLISTEDDLVT